MSTNPDNNKVIASNPATQTLFRFASLRNPQLAEAKNNDNFIVRNFLTTGHFDTLIQEWYEDETPKGISKLEYISQQIIVNSEVVTIKKNEKELKLVLGYFQTAGKIIAQKRDWETLDDVELLMGEIHIKVQESNSTEGKLLRPTTHESKTIWDSLMYQVLTQENFYLKEIIIQSLQAINYYQYYQEHHLASLSPTVADYKRKASAKVVIPDYIFIDAAIPEDEDKPFTVNETEIGGSYIYEMNKLNQKVLSRNINSDFSEMNYSKKLETMELSIALHKRDQLDLLSKELKKLQKNYVKASAKAYNEAFEQHQAIVKPLLLDYDRALQGLEATFTPEMSEVNKKDALDALQLPAIPEFIFENEPERNLEIFSQKLTQSSLETLIQLTASEEEAETDLSGIPSNNVLTLENRTVVFPTDQYLTFNEIFETIEENLTEVYEDLNVRADSQREQFVEMGGVLIPLNKSEETAFAYSLMTSKRLISGTRIPSASWEYYLSLNLPDDTWNIESMNYEVTTNSGIIKTGTYFTFTRTEGQIFITNLFANSFLISREDYPVNFEINVIFTNGESTKILLDRQLVAGLLYNGIFRLDSDTDNANTQNNVFVPNGFGIKRLGIADYMKVEQYTHAYVEGEVANIENIMAREYRDKSTRRLRRSEITESSSTETEREKLTDTTTANRYEMQTEVSKLLQDEKMKEGHASFGKSGDWHFEVGGSFANRTSKETATRQAVSKSQDVTARALDRIVSKVKQERVEKIIEEFEENNSHGFDNRKGDQHVVGVYRWVDKLMKNQIYNYGKRMMLEFMIPQPAKLHELALGKVTNMVSYSKPVDPRTDATHQMKDAVSATEQVIQHWADYYKVEITPLPAKNKTHNIPRQDFKLDGNGGAQSYNIDILENYVAKSGKIIFGHNRETHGVFGNKPHTLYFSNLNGGTFSNTSTSTYFSIGEKNVNNINVAGNYQYSFRGDNLDGCYFAFDFNCELSNEFILSWKQDLFTKIIAAYDVAIKEWEEKTAASKAESEKEKAKEENTKYYRQIEEVVLKHNSIAYLLQNYAKLGTKLYQGTSMKNFKVLLGKDLNEYTALAKFMEQAFEWEIMDYTFYPYYWGNKEDWQKMYLSESIDPLFRSFLQAGMGRVIVTVTPGFEDAVNFYLATGKIWNGGEVPIIGDPLYLSIADELREPQGEKYGKPWVTRLPTSLTILQAESIGLNVEHALPFTTEDPMEFENPRDVITAEKFNFITTDATMQSLDSQVLLQLADQDTPREQPQNVLEELE